MYIIGLGLKWLLLMEGWVCKWNYVIMKVIIAGTSIWLQNNSSLSGFWTNPGLTCDKDGLKFPASPMQLLCSWWCNPSQPSLIWHKLLHCNKFHNKRFIGSLIKFYTVFLWWIHISMLHILVATTLKIKSVVPLLFRPKYKSCLILYCERITPLLTIDQDPRYIYPIRFFTPCYIDMFCNL